MQELQIKREAHQKETTNCTTDLLIKKQQSEGDLVHVPNEFLNRNFSEGSDELAEFAEANNGNDFIRRFLILFYQLHYYYELMISA
jgi:hypothetical protein